MKKIISKKLIALLVFGLISINFISCDDSLDINENPLAATEVEPSLLFPQVIAQMSSNRTIEYVAMNFQSQKWASGGSAGVFTDPEQYIISTFTTGNSWSSFYTGGLKNLDLMQQLQEQNRPEDVLITAQAKVVEAFLYLLITQVWEDAPQDQAIQPLEFPNPEFDSQEEVLNGVNDLVDEAVALFNQNPDAGILTSADIIFNGDVDSWVRFANSIKFKSLMILTSGDSSYSSQLQAVANSPLILDNSQEAKLNYTADIGDENPIWKLLDLFAGGDNAFLFSGKTLVDLMNDIEDPRRPTYFDPVTVDGEEVFVGQEQGVLNSAGISPISLNILRPDYPDRYITAAEMNLLLAEAAEKGYISGNASTLYLEGVSQALDFFDGKPGAIDSASKDAYIASLPTSPSLEDIYTQEYIELFTRGLESWTHWRRTKFPSFELPQGAQLGDIIRRYPYPPDEVGANANVPTQKPLDQPMWFEGN